MAASVSTAVDLDATTRRGVAARRSADAGSAAPRGCCGSRALAYRPGRPSLRSAAAWAGVAGVAALSDTAPMNRLLRGAAAWLGEVAGALLRRRLGAPAGHTWAAAGAERPKLPKMLRRKDLLETVANGCLQGLYVLSLPRPDETARSWWRMPVDEDVLADDALEAVQNRAAVLDALDPGLLAPGKLEGLDFKNGLKVADLVSYFDGFTLTIDHPDEGWTEEKPIPRCPEAKVLEAVGVAVKAGTVWLTSGTASVWGEAPLPGIVSKAAMLRVPPSRSVSLRSRQRRSPMLGAAGRRRLTP